MAIISLLVPLVLIGAIFLIIVIYKNLYKNNMNRALEGEATPGLIDVGSLLKTLSIITLLILNIVLLTKVNDLSYQVGVLQSNLSSQISTVSSRVSSLSYEMTEYYQSLELIQDKEKELKSIDLENDTYTYTIEFTLLEKEVDADVYIVVSHNGETTNYPVSSTSLTYIEDIAFDYSVKEYEISVLIEGTTLIQDDLFSINVIDAAENIVRAGIAFGEGNEGFIIVPFVTQTVDYVEDVEVTSVKFEVFEENVLIDTIHVNTPTDMNALIQDYQEAFDFYEYQEDDIQFAILYEVEGPEELSFVLTITLSDGTVLERTIGL